MTAGWMIASPSPHLIVGMVVMAVGLSVFVWPLIGKVMPVLAEKIPEHLQGVTLVAVKLAISGVGVALGVSGAALMVWAITRERTIPLQDRAYVALDQVISAYRSAPTTAKADVLIQDYLGKWVNVSGIVSDVSNDLYPRLFERQGLVVSIAAQSAFVGLHFRGLEADRVSTLQRGDALRADCRVADVHALGVSLDHCENK